MGVSTRASRFNRESGVLGPSATLRGELGPGALSSRRGREGAAGEWSRGRVLGYRGSPSQSGNSLPSGPPSSHTNSRRSLLNFGFSSSDLNLYRGRSLRRLFK